MHLLDGAFSLMNNDAFFLNQTKNPYCGANIIVIRTA